MPWFKASKIFLDKESVAVQLTSTRERLGATLPEVAARLKINLKYLQALEEGNYNLLPAGIYGLNYLREYGRFLNLDYDKLLKKFLQEQRVYQSGGQRHLFARQTVGRKYFVAMPNVLKYSLIFLAAVICLVYLWFLVQNIFVPPRLTVTSPLDNLITGKSTVVVAGQTDPETEILINDQQVMVSAAGEFSEEVNLKPGVNVITVTAQKGAKRKNTAVKEILLKAAQN